MKKSSTDQHGEVRVLSEKIVHGFKEAEDSMSLIPPKSMGLLFYHLEGHETVATDTHEGMLRSAASIGTQVAVTRLSGDRILISTAFLGTDLNFGRGEPLLFETMMFVDGDSRGCKRYSTWDQAEQGHKDIVSRVSVESDEILRLT